MMNKMKTAADLVRSGEITYIDYIYEMAAADIDLSEGEFLPWDAAYWRMVRDAHRNGKKLIFISGPIPSEIIYSLDCVPLYLDLLPSRLSSNIELISWLTGETEKKINPNLCRLNKAQIGTLLVGKLGVSPDAYVSVPIPCDSARSAYSSISRLIQAPVFNFDVPLRLNERSLDYVEAQFSAFIDFMEHIANKKLDYDKLKYRLLLSNNANELLEKCVLLRKKKPCPMSSHMNIWNELMNAFAPTEDILKLLSQELDICNIRLAGNKSPCPEGEKHRVLLMHNMLWQGTGITDWLEKRYGAVTVMDGYSFKKREYFENIDNESDCVKVMCRRMIGGSTIHGAGEHADELLSRVHNIINEYEADVSIFLGNAGCRHEWAYSKMLSDSIHEKFGITTLMIDVDNTDIKYKTEGEIKTAISEFIDTVVNRRS